MSKNILIVGQGLAGTLLSYELIKAGCSVNVMEADLPNSASSVAAGLINPITGRRVVKSSMIDTLLPVAKSTYQDLEKLLGVQIWHERNILWLHDSEKEHNEWVARCGAEDLKPFIAYPADDSAAKTYLKPYFDSGEVHQSAQVDVQTLVRAYKRYLIDNQIFVNTNGRRDYHQIVDKAYDLVIFCRGHWDSEHPLFGELPWQSSKGEALTITLKDAQFAKIIKQNITIIPMSNDTYWAGSNYNWTLDSLLPTEEMALEMKGQLNDLLNSDYEILAHKAAIRPTNKHRVPMIGFHPYESKYGIFNGLGSKGTSLAPYWAAHFASHITQKTPLDPLVNVAQWL